MGRWTEQEAEAIGAADDFHISPFREDGVTHGTPTWIWSVAVEGLVYVRAYNGTDSRWYNAAMTQKAGRIRTAGFERDVVFTESPRELDQRIDAAYRAKYATSPYLSPMIGEKARAATVRVDPR